MALFLIRDDDPNATTDPARLERTYAPLLDAGIKVTFSVIPEVALDTRAPDGHRERFIDPGWPDTPDEITLTARAPLARWLRDHAGEVEAMAHGLSHRRVRGGTELGALDEDEADERLVQGRDILCTALGRYPTGFVAPWDALSRGALVAATRRFSLVSAGWVGFPRLPPSAWPAHVVERLRRSEALRVGPAWVVRHRGGRFDGRSDPASVPGVLDELAKGADAAVIVLHHWMFWDRPGEGPHPVVTALARALRGRRVGGVEDMVRHLDARAGERAIRPSLTGLAGAALGLGPPARRR
jgi:hypothetical protein